MADFAITITGTVPVIAHVKDDVLFCNAQDGYVLWLVHADGTRTKLEESDRSVDKPFIFAVPTGARLELDLK